MKSQAISWFAMHWVGITALGTALGTLIGWFMQLWLSKEERKQLKEQNRQMEYRMKVMSCEDQIHMMANEVKGRKGTHDVLFSEAEIREWAREEGWEGYAHAALQSLREKGRAELSSVPNHYYIDRPKF